MDPLYLIAGLGNPGPEYANTRHNAGFLALQKFAERRHASWKFQEHFSARVARVEFAGQKVWLCEPQTYMNLSGHAVGPVAAYFKIPLEKILVLVDDANLPFGEIRLRPAGSSGGHHGLESIERALGSREHPRLRIGIGRRSRQITGHVLGRFNPDETRLLTAVLDRVADQIECWLASGIQKAMSQFNGVVQTPLAKEN